MELKKQNPDIQIDFNAFKMSEDEKLQNEIDRVCGQKKFDENSSIFDYPRKGSNNKVKETDLRIWDTLFIESLKVLNKWDQFHDIARAVTPNSEIPNLEMMIEYSWNTKQWNYLRQQESILKRSDSIKHRLYYIFLAIKDQRFDIFDEAFKTVVNLSYSKWDTQLPKYVDNVHFENLILYQLIMEGSEGGRNMIKEASQARSKSKLVDLKTAINIWRERVPHICESIQTWKEVLENRNFIQEQISEIMVPYVVPPQLPPGISE